MLVANRSKPRADRGGIDLLSCLQVTSPLPCFQARNPARKYRRAASVVGSSFFFGDLKQRAAAFDFGARRRAVATNVSRSILMIGGHTYGAPIVYISRPTSHSILRRKCGMSNEHGKVQPSGDIAAIYFKVHFTRSYL